MNGRTHGVTVSGTDKIDRSTLHALQLHSCLVTVLPNHVQWLQKRKTHDLNAGGSLLISMR